MASDNGLVGRSFPPTPVHRVTEESVAAFNAAIGSASSSVPPTYPIVVTFAALEGFLAAEQFELSRIVHGDQKFRYERAVVIGDELSATLRVTGVRSIGGNDIIGTSSDITDGSGALVCTATATILHRGGTS